MLNRCLGQAPPESQKNTLRQACGASVNLFMEEETGRKKWKGQNQVLQEKRVAQEMSLLHVALFQ